MSPKAQKTKKRLLCLIIVVLILVLVFFFVRTTKAYGRMVLRLYKRELTEVAANVMNTHIETRWHGMRVRYEESQTTSDRRVVFEITGFGIAPSSNIRGLYYSPDNRIITGYLSYSPSDNGVGYYAEEINGDNRFYTEPLGEDWFWFTEHY